LRALALVVIGLVCGLLLAPQSVQAAINYFNETKIVYGSYGSARCPYGWKLTGGGAKLPGDSYYSSRTTEYKLEESYPSSSTTWRATGTKVSGSYSSSYGWRYTDSNYYPRTYAICTR
jgi:hypothetical protein